MDTTSAANEDATKRELVTAAVGDRCSSCNAHLAIDQRYCVNCGERRGKARFSFAGTAGQAPVLAPATEPRLRSRGSASTTLVAGVGTLVLALGVGVLIGHNGNSNPIQRASSPQVVTVAGGGTSSAAATTATSAGKSSHKGSKRSSTPKALQAKVSTQTAHKAAAAASKVLGAGAPANPTVQPGQKSSGPGTQNGKFTGSFFGQ